MIGQFVWRMVYYPSGDSIYINPFSATYLSTYDLKVITDSTHFANKTCPVCGALLVEKKTKDGKHLVCSESECGYKE